MILPDLSWYDPETNSPQYGQACFGHVHHLDRYPQDQIVLRFTREDDPVGRGGVFGLLLHHSQARGLAAALLYQADEIERRETKR